jgi:hypothetical protein
MEVKTVWPPAGGHDGQDNHGTGTGAVVVDVNRLDQATQANTPLCCRLGARCARLRWRTILLAEALQRLVTAVERSDGLDHAVRAARRLLDGDRP